MSSHPSPASTARPSDAPSRAPASSSEREDFLNSALARLSLSRVNSPAPPSLAQPVLPMAAESGSSQSGTFETLGTRSSPPPAPLSQQEELPQPGSTFFSHSGSRTSSFTDVLMTPDEAESLADSLGRGPKSEKLVFWQSLVVQFDLCDLADVPKSITGCKDLLAGVHISIREYLNAVKKGKSVKNTVKQHRSRKALRDYLLEGPPKKK